MTAAVACSCRSSHPAHASPSRLGRTVRSQVGSGAWGSKSTWIAACVAMPRSQRSSAPAIHRRAPRFAIT
eukprot:10065409-Lingulodinium_polyedra.AAC.1